MHPQLTMAIFAGMTVMLILLRLSWCQLSPRMRRAVLIAALVALPLWPISAITHWSTSSDRLNNLLYWAFIAAYELLLLLFTLLRPYWLTSLFAFTLLAPLLSASAFLPLSDLFDRAPQPPTPLSSHLSSQLVPFIYPGSDITGADLEVYSRPAWLPFLQHKAQGARYYNTQCDAFHASAKLEPDGRHLLMNCPAWSGQSPNTARILVVRLR